MRWRITLTFHDAGLGPGLLMWVLREAIRVVDESPVPVRVRVERLNEHDPPGGGSRGVV